MALYAYQPPTTTTRAAIAPPPTINAFLICQRLNRLLDTDPSTMLLPCSLLYI